jgi:hypothetical protein
METVIPPGEPFPAAADGINPHGGIFSAAAVIINLHCGVFSYLSRMVIHCSGYAL